LPRLAKRSRRGQAGIGSPAAAAVPEVLREVVAEVGLEAELIEVAGEAR